MAIEARLDVLSRQAPAPTRRGAPPSVRRRAAATAAAARLDPEAAAATPWSFKLLGVFILLLYSSLPLLVPAIAPYAPAQAVAVAALAALAVERSLTRRPFLLAWPESHLLLAFLAAAAVSSFTALWMRWAVENTLELLKFIVVYVLIVNTVESWRRLRTAFALLAVGALFPALGALVHLRAGELVEENRTAWIGVFANPNDLAYALVLVFPLALALALDSRGWRRLAWCGALAAYAAAIFSTYSRGGLVGFVAVLLLCGLRWARPWARLPALVLALAATAGAVGMLWSRDEGFADLVADATVHQRLDTIRAGLAMFADRPLLGVGLGCSVIGWGEYAPEHAASHEWLHSHNTAAQLLGETGLAGTVPFVLLFGVALAKTRRLGRRWRLAGRHRRYRLVSALEIALWGFVVCGLSGGYVMSWYPYLLAGLVSAAWLVSRGTVDRVGEPAAEAADGRAHGRAGDAPDAAPGFGTGGWRAGEALR
jgi:O-antigen ligase